MGLHIAGWDVDGVDQKDHPTYPFQLTVADALTVDLGGVDAYLAGPPCQGYGRLRHRQDASKWPLLIDPVRERLEATGKPYVIENVEDAAWAMKNPVRLCGSSFGLRVRRHRLFEANFAIPELPCDHSWQDLHKPYKLYVGKERTNGLGYRHSGIQPVYGGNHNVGGSSHFLKSVAMGIDWMSEEDLNEAIPPVFGTHIGRAMLRALGDAR
jgi:DNA (cytosine-5)-methyltransferase 1